MSVTLNITAKDVASKTLIRVNVAAGDVEPPKGKAYLKSGMRLAIAVDKSGNSKISNKDKGIFASATYAGQRSCSKDCPFLPPELGGKGKGGCYANAGHTRFTTSRVNKSEATPFEIATEEANAIDDLKGANALRLHVVGDCPNDEAAKIVSGAAMRYLARSWAAIKAKLGNHRKHRHKLAVWTYTHSWRDVLRSSWLGVSVLASCHSHEETQQAMRRGYAASMTVDTMPPKAYKIDDTTYLPCLEMTHGIPCVDCRLCWDDKRLHAKKIVILFALHSSVKKALGSIKDYLS